MYRITYSVIFL